MGDRQVKVSVLVPIYKVEKYLHRCLDSVISQNFQDYELVLVDDGSPDNCPAICDKYQSRYPDIVKIIHKENKGLPSARLAGFEVAKGEYVIFVDSDDYMASGSLQALYSEISKGYDVVRGRIMREDLQTGNQWHEQYNYDGRTITSNDEYFKAVMVQKIPPYLHSGIYRKDLFDIGMFQKLVDSGISLGEDWIINVAISYRVKKFKSIDMPCYYYCVNSASMIYTSLYSYRLNDIVEQLLYSLTEHFPIEYKRWVKSNRMATNLYSAFVPELGYDAIHYDNVRAFINDDDNFALLKTHIDLRFVKFAKHKLLFRFYSKVFCWLYMKFKLKGVSRKVLQ